MYARGKSFDFTIWNPQKTYVNDEYKQDFVSYQGNLYACIRTNTNIAPTNKFYWVVCIELSTNNNVICPSFLIDEGEPTNYAVVDNSIYLNLLNNTFYEFNNGVWKQIGTLNTGTDLDWGEF